MAADRSRPVARDQQLAHADQIDRAQHQADDFARAGHTTFGGDPGRPQSDRGAVGRSRPFPARLRAARPAAEAAAADLRGDAAGAPTHGARGPAARHRRSRPTIPSIKADPDQIEQLLINIIRNAVDASLETNGGVSLDWKQVDGSLQISVEDEGPGLPDTANLFVPFFTTKPAGSGIGLALSRQIAEAHGGTLTLENRTDARGCRATLRLPNP